MKWIKIQKKLINLDNAKVIQPIRESKLEEGGYYFSIQWTNDKYENFNYNLRQLAEDDYNKLLQFISNKQKND